MDTIDNIVSSLNIKYFNKIEKKPKGHISIRKEMVKPILSKYVEYELSNKNVSIGLFINKHKIKLDCKLLIIALVYYSTVIVSILKGHNSGIYINETKIFTDFRFVKLLYVYLKLRHFYCEDSEITKRYFDYVDSNTVPPKHEKTPIFYYMVNFDKT
jgi:hypothetical protein